MVTLLAASDYPAVRAALDVSLQPSRLPDAVIGLPVYAGRAVQWVTDRLAASGLTPDTLSGSHLQHAQNAAVFACAAFLAPAVPSITAEAVEGALSYQRSSVDWFRRQEGLLGSASAELDAAVAATAPAAAPRPKYFTLAPGRRGL